MYQTTELLSRIDDNAIGLLIGLGVAMACQTVWLVAAARVAKRDRLYSIPLVCTFFWFAHDIGFVVRFREWFVTYDHWFFKLFWLGLLSAALLEFVFFAQILRYGRPELAPTLSQRQFAMVIAVAILGAILAWEYVRHLVDDPLYIASSALTLLSYALFGPPLLLRRKGSAGQTRLMWVCFTMMTAAWWITTVAFLGPIFQSWQYISIGVFGFAVGVAMIVAFSRVGAGEKEMPHGVAPSTHRHEMHADGHADRVVAKAGIPESARGASAAASTID